jgi:dihydrofolate reductase
VYLLGKIGGLPLRTVVLYVTMSVDCYIAGPADELDWLPEGADTDFGYAEFLANVDTLLMGRRTYDVIEALGEWPYDGKTTIVFSSTRSGEDDRVRFVSDRPEEFVRELKNSPGGDIWLVGGGRLAATLSAAGLIDRMRIFVQPVLLGKGIPLFPAGMPRQNLELTSTTHHALGVVELDYLVRNG